MKTEQMCDAKLNTFSVPYHKQIYIYRFLVFWEEVEEEEERKKGKVERNHRGYR
jgi:hypothetical protein